METEADRFEFARRHIVKSQKLEERLHEARDAEYAWRFLDAFGRRLKDRHGLDTERRPKTPDERAEFKALEAATIDARARKLLHDNDGRLL